MSAFDAIFRQPGKPKADSFDAADARKVMLDVISEWGKVEPTSLQTGPILREVIGRLNYGRELEYEQGILTLWYDLFRSGQLSVGFDLDNPDLPHCHLTDLGRETLKHASCCQTRLRPGGVLQSHHVVNMLKLIGIETRPNCMLVATNSAEGRVAELRMG